MRKLKEGFFSFKMKDASEHVFYADGNKIGERVKKLMIQRGG